jgi:hypothetical protein
VRFCEEEGVFVTTLRHFRGQIEIEDTAFFVVAYDPETGEIDLSDRTTEFLDAATLSLDPDDALRCRVKQRFPARFTHAGQAHLLDALEEREPGLCLRVGGAWVHVPDLSRAP